MKLLLVLAMVLAMVLCDESKVSSDHVANDAQGRSLSFHGARPATIASDYGYDQYQGNGYHGNGNQGNGYTGNRRIGTGYPGTGYPGTGYPGTGYPGTGYPGTGYPGTGYPGTGYPGTGYPGGNPYVRPSGCKNWCKRDNHGYGRQQYYCCDRSGPHVYRPAPAPIVVRPPYQRPHPPIGRHKVCPPAQPVCLRSYHAASPPIECYSDAECSTVDSCCYDTCLSHKVCKTADYVDGVAVPYDRKSRHGQASEQRRRHRRGPLASIISIFTRDGLRDEPAVAADEAKVRFGGDEKHADAVVVDAI